MADTNLPLNVFPGLVARDIVHDSVKELVVAFNSEGLEALSGVAEESVAWADVGTRVTPGVFEAKIPVRLSSLLGYNPFTGERHYHQAGLAAVNVKAGPFDLNAEFDIRLLQQGGELVNFYGLNGLPQDIVTHSRAHKSMMLTSLLIAGQTNASLSMTATALTLAQPGYSSGLPLFSDGSTSGASKHYSNPLDANSKTFSNLHLNAGKITDSGVFAGMLTNMRQVPHPTILNMTLGIGVTDVFGGTNMMDAFQMLAVQQLALQTTTYSSTNLAAATTNIYTPEAMMRAKSYISAAGIQPVRFHICPQLDSHPYLVAHPTYQMWYAVSNSRGGAWAEFIAPSKEFTPRVTILGDGSEEAAKTRKVRIITDLDAGVAAGLPHFIQAYFETTP